MKMSTTKLFLTMLWSVDLVLLLIIGSEANLTDNLKYFETMRSSDLSHNIVKRGANPDR